jgi:hypothetical protein
MRNILGWKTKRKILVIESDDWGSIRMPSLSVFQKLEKSGIDLRSMDAERFNLNDSLETSNDLERLFDVLTIVKDKNGNYPVFTPVCVVANPDFKRIKSSDYSEYYYEPFTETYKNYLGCEDTYSLLLEGIRNKIFYPQSHGREHLNITSWMKALSQNDLHTHLAFSEGMWGFVPDQNSWQGIDFQAALLLHRPEEIELHKRIIEEGLALFEKLFGYKAVYFVPPNGHMNNVLNKTLVGGGIKLRYSTSIQPETIGFGQYRKTLNWLGKKDKDQILYVTRNCTFEPSITSRDWIDTCLRDISLSFSWRRPAIINTHRVNYIGVINPVNSDKGLRQLRTLLKKVKILWPEVEFMSTGDLGKLMTYDSFK